LDSLTVTGAVKEPWYSRDRTIADIKSEGDTGEAARRDARKKKTGISRPT